MLWRMGLALNVISIPAVGTGGEENGLLKIPFFVFLLLCLGGALDPTSTYQH